MPEKVSPASAFLPAVNFLFSQSDIGIAASGSVRHRWSRIIPTLPGYAV
jgi:hypothetical protein